MTKALSAKVQAIGQLVLGITCAPNTFLGQGASSAAWRVSTGKDSFIVRIMPPGTNRPVTYQSEFTILRQLRAHGCLVPDPIVNSAECDKQLPNISEAWTVTRAVDGRASLNEKLSTKAAHELGNLLSILHELPVVGLGRLAEQADGLCGLQSDRLSGVVGRLCWAKLWPLDSSSLEEHPVVRVAPQFVTRLHRCESDILSIITTKPVMLVHADLHGEHIFTQGEKLTGLIDFGAAFIGSPLWDFASLAFYHGWATVREILVGYTVSENERVNYTVQAKLLALVLSLYKLDKAVAENAPQKKIHRITKFIEAMF